MPVQRGIFWIVFILLVVLTFTHSFRPCRSTIVHRNLVQPVTHSMNTRSMKLYGAIIDLEGEDETPGEAVKVETHGYEGDFKVGDVVRVKADIRIWSVKEHSKEGFVCTGYEGTVKELVLYGRKLKTLCSAITPCKVEFAPDGKGIPPGMFARKWTAHFAGDELELIQKGPPPE